MNKVGRRTVTLLPPLVYVALFLFLEIYAFWHSRQANLGLAVIMVAAPGLVGLTYTRLRRYHHVFDGDPLRPYTARITIGFLIASVWFATGAYLVRDPEGQVMIATGPVVIVTVLLVGYYSDKVSRARREEQKRSVKTSEKS
jgi:hypothetical protein